MSETKENSDVEKFAKYFIALRDKKKALVDAHKKELEPIEQLMAQIQGRLEQILEFLNAQNVKTSAGTVHKIARYSAGLTDPKAFMDFVIAEQRFDLLDRKANVTAVRAYVEEHKAKPPGVNLSAIRSVGVRRPGEKSDD